jgi:hypothetical protein
MCLCFQFVPWPVAQPMTTTDLLLNHGLPLPTWLPQIPARTASHVFSMRAHIARMQSHGFNRYGSDPTGPQIPAPSLLAEMTPRVRRSSTGGGTRGGSTGSNTSSTGSSTSSTVAGNTGSNTSSTAPGSNDANDNDRGGEGRTVLVRGYHQAMQQQQVHMHPDLGFTVTGPPTVKTPQVGPGCQV